MKLTDFRQLIFRGVLAQIFPWLAGQNGQTIIASIDKELQPPFVVTATSTPSLVVNVGPSLVVNTINNRNKAASFNGTQLPSFPGGTVTFPAASGGNILTSTGGSLPLTLAPGEYVQVLLAIDTSNNLSTTVGTPNAVLASAVVPQPAASTQPFSYVTLQNIGGVIQNVAQSRVVQLAGSGSGSGGNGGVAQEVSLTMGTTSQVVTFPSPQSSSNYIILGNIYNPTDTLPEFFPMTVSAKTTTTATFEWNQPLDSSNYLLDYAINPGLAMQAGEAPISLGDTSVTITMPLPIGSTNYIVMAEMIDTVDSTPQFQPCICTAKSASTFTISWNMPVDSSNYRIAWQLAAYA